jgi:hypothetical protein
VEGADVTITELARRQHGIFLGSQARERGVSRKMLRHRVAIGRISSVAPDTYLVGGSLFTWEAKLLSCVLAGGEGALASHRAAAVLWGLGDFNRGTPEVTVPRGVRLRREGVRIHESTDLDRCGTRRRNGIPVTDPARTLLDLARRLEDQRLTRAIESARRLKLTTWSELIACLGKHARCGRPGITRLRRVITDNVHREEITDSDFELLVLVLLVEGGLPEPVLHHVVRDAEGRPIGEVDLAYPDLRIAIELDGGDHMDKSVFERDRPRQNQLVLAGWTILRFTWDAYRTSPAALVAAVRQALTLTVAA